MRSAGVVRAWLAVLAATMVFAGAAQAAQPGANGEIPSQAEVDGAIAALKNGTGQIKELKAPRPDWFTPQLAQRVHENGMTAAPVDAPLPGQVGIRPGSMMISPFICTMNYIFQKGGVVAMTRAIALELAPHGIRVNAPRMAWEARLMIAPRRPPSIMRRAAACAQKKLPFRLTSRT